MKPWPKDPEERPTADQIARALVAAAKQTGDTERLAQAARDLGEFRNLVLRARWVALDALNQLYPRCGLATLAAKVGYLGANPMASLIAARTARWWSKPALDAVIAAI